MTRTSWSASASSMATASSSRSCGVMVLYSAARVRTIDRTPSPVSVRNVLGMNPPQFEPAVKRHTGACILTACSSGGAAAGFVDGGVAGVHHRPLVVGDDSHVQRHEPVALALGDLLDEGAGRDAVAVMDEAAVLDVALHVDPRS